MRTSAKRTTTAVLRSILGIKDFEMAELLGCSPPTIHSLESGRLKLSVGLAMRMFHESGISPDWLLAEDPKAPPVSVDSKPFTKQTFDRARAAKASRDTLPEHVFWLDVLDFAARLASTLLSARIDQEYDLARYKTWKALEALSAEFGRDLPTYSPTESSLGSSSVLLAKDADQARKVLDKMLAAYAELEAAFAPLLRRTQANPKNRKRPTEQKRR